MSSRREFLKVAGIGTVAGLSGCTGSPGGGSNEMIKIGFNAPLTGFASADGQSASHGAELAQKIINEQGGIDGREIELVVRDDEAKADAAVPAAQSLINEEQVDIGVSGSYSTPTRAIAPIYDQNSVPFVSSYATHPDITEGEYTYRLGMLATLQGKAQARIAAEEIGADSCVALTLDNDYGQVVSESFQEAAQNQYDISMEYTTKYPIGEDNFRPILSQVKEMEPDILSATAYYGEAASLVKQADKMGVEAQILGSEGYDSPKFFELGGSATDGTVIVTPLRRGSDLPAAQEYLEQYQSEYGQIADAVAGLSHDAVKLVGKIVSEAGGTNADDMLSALENLQDWRGAASGPIEEFVGPGEAVRKIPAVQASDGNWEPYSLITDPEFIRPDV